jgi:hypothetical protein
MKKALFLAALALLMACTKENQNAEQVTVTFQVGGIQTGAITKAGTPEAALAASAPSGAITLRLVSTTNDARRYNVTAGQAVSLPADTYNVTGEYIPQVVTAVYHGNAYREPRYSVSTTIQVTEEETITIPARYECIALVIDFTQSAKYLHTNASLNMEEITAWQRSGDYGVIYVACTSYWSTAGGYTIQSFPVDEAEGEMRSYRLHTTGAGGIIVEKGKWYCFSPGEVAKVSGSLAPTFPAWQNGNLTE